MEDNEPLKRSHFEDFQQQGPTPLKNHGIDESVQGSSDGEEMLGKIEVKVPTRDMLKKVKRMQT